MRNFRAEDAEADCRAWAEVEFSAGEFPGGTPDERLGNAIARFNEEFMPHVSVRHRSPTGVDTWT